MTRPPTPSRLTHLTLVPTPIGNLADITLRALQVLREADAIAAEDTRHTRKLLEHHGIDRPLVRLDAHTIRRRGLAPLADYAQVAFVSDAGTPGISDPGADLVRLALEQGISVEALPGPTAFVPALIVSGLPVARFCFEGFLPRKGSARRDRLRAIAGSPVTVAFYESPRRLRATLVELAELCGGDRRASVSRELSKRFETTVRGTLAELAQQFTDTEARGEVTVVVAPAEVDAAADRDAFVAAAAELARHGLQGRELRQALEARGAPRNLAYELALEHGATPPNTPDAE